MIRFTDFKGPADKALWHDEEISGKLYLLVDVPQKKRAEACIYIGDSIGSTLYHRPNFKKFTLRFRPGLAVDYTDGEPKPEAKVHGEDAKKP